MNATAGSTTNRLVGSVSRDIPDPHRATAAFSPSAARCAVPATSVDGTSILLFDTASARQLARIHAPAPNTALKCIKWCKVDGRVVPASLAPKKRKVTAATVAKQAEALLVVYSDGKVHVHSVAEPSVILRKFEDGNAVDACVSPDGATLFLCGANGVVAVTDLVTGAISARIKTNLAGSLRVTTAGNRLLVAGHRIEVWDWASAARIKTMQGHTGAVSNIAVSSEGSYLITSAEQDRRILVWSLENTNATSPVSSVSAEAYPVSVSVGLDASILAVLENGRIEAWVAASAGVFTTGFQGHASAGITSQHGASVPIFAAIFSGASKAYVSSVENVLIARGLMFKPDFEELSFIDEDDKSLVDLKLTRSAEANILAIKSAEKGNTLLHKTAQNMLDDGGVPVSILAHDPGSDEDESTTEQTMAEKLANLHRQGPDAPTHRLTNDPSKSAIVPKADSVHPVLVQALRTSDAEMLETCLQYGSKVLVNNTVRKLPVQLVVPLIDALTLRFRTTPHRAQKLSIWLRSVLMFHMTYLSSLPGVMANLARLHRAIETRNANALLLNRLHGRIDLLLSQMELQQSAMGQATDYDVLGRSARRLLDDADSEFDSTSAESDVASEDIGDSDSPASDDDARNPELEIDEADSESEVGSASEDIGDSDENMEDSDDE